jgi:putative ABC transport system substrate-binding protein
VIGRREFITLLGGAAAALPLSARAQQPRMPIIGLLNGASFEGFYAPLVAEFRLGLKEKGFVEGQNVAIEYRAAEGRPERLRDLAADLARLRVAVIVTIGGSTSALAAKATTSTIPIVFAMGGDAVDLGLVKTLNKPEANVTGMSFTTSQLAPKRLDLLRGLVPQAELIGYLDNTATSSEIVRRDLLAKAESIGRKIGVFYPGTEQEIDRAFKAMSEQGVGALVVSTDAYLATRRDQIVSLAGLHALPTIYPEAPITMQPGLISYGILIGEMFRQAGVYVGRLLSGANIADLPVQLPTRFKLVINLKTAKALGLTVPPAILAIADEVFE